MVAFVRRHYKPLPGPTEPVPVDSQMDLSLVKAEPTREAAPCEEGHGRASWPHAVSGNPWRSRHPLCRL